MTEWTFESLKSGYRRTCGLVLLWECDGSPMSDDYTPDEADAAELWRLWVNRYHRDNEVCQISWFVTTPQGVDVLEGAPFTIEPPDWPKVGDFLTSFTWPRNERTGEPVNWLRLPVVDLHWNRKQDDKGGFVQEVTGWKPSPLQPSVNLRQLASAARLYWPT